MVYCTYLAKQVHCPVWNIDVHLNAKYRMSDDESTPYRAYFEHAKCPIYENGLKHISDQNPTLKLMYCPDKASCSLLTDFPSEVDVRQCGL